MRPGACIVRACAKTLMNAKRVTEGKEVQTQNPGLQACLKERARKG